MTTTFFPTRNIYARPSFWGVQRDLKDVMDSIENIWEGNQQSTSELSFKETETGYLMALDMPGVSKDNLEIQLENELIKITATRKRTFFGEENNTETIKKSLVIPSQVDTDKIQAHCEDGVLYLALPKVEKAKPKKINISTGKGSKWTNLLSE